MVERRYFRGGHRNFVVHDGGDSAGYFHKYEPLRTESSLYPERTIDVFLPRNYDPNEDRYPVLYLNDGTMHFLTWRTEGRMHLAMRALFRRPFGSGWMTPRGSRPFNHCRIDCSRTRNFLRLSRRRWGLP